MTVRLIGAGLPRTGMTAHLQRRFAERWDDPATAKAAYEAHVAAVREAIPPERLFEYVPGDGWGPQKPAGAPVAPTACLADER